MKHIVVRIGWRCYEVFMSCSILSMIVLPMTAAPQRPRCMRHNIHRPWIVNGVDFHSCWILKNIISTSFVQIPRVIVTLLCWYQLSFSIHHNLLIRWWKTNRRTNDYSLLIWILNVLSIIMYFFTQGRISSIRRDSHICYDVIIRLVWYLHHWTVTISILTDRVLHPFLYHVTYRSWSILPSLSRLLHSVMSEVRSYYVC